MKRLTHISLLLLLTLGWAGVLPVQSWAAVAYDASSKGSGGGAGGTLTVAHTTSGSNRVLYGCVTGYDNTYNTGDLTATYNGVSMTSYINDTTTNANRPIHVFRLIAPATGANNFVLSWPSGTRYFSVLLASFTGAHQTTPEDTADMVDGGGGGNIMSNAITSATDDMVMDCIVLHPATTGFGVDAGQGNTEMQTEETGSFNVHGISYEAGAATVTVGWDWVEFVDYLHYGWNINAAAAGGAAAPRGLLLGVN